MNIQKHTLTAYSNPAYNAGLESRLNELLQKLLVKDGGWATRNLPSCKGDNLEFYWEEFHLEYQLLLNENSAQLQPETTKFEVAKSNEDTQREIQQLVNKEIELKDYRITLESKFKNQSPCLRIKNSIYVKSTLAAVGLMEGIFSVPIFERFGMSFIGASVGALIFGGVITVFAHNVPWLINRGRTIWERRLITYTLLAGTSFLFWTLAKYRTEYLTENMKAQGVFMEFSAWPFTLMSILLMLVAIILPIIYMPSTEEILKHKAYLKAKNDLEEINNEIDKVITQKADIEKANTQNVVNKASIFEYGQNKEQQIVNSAMSTYHAWKQHNVMHRPDGQKPDIFSNVYPFPFKTYFHLNNKKS